MTSRICWVSWTTPKTVWKVCLWVGHWTFQLIFSPFQLEKKNSKMQKWACNEIVFWGKLFRKKINSQKKYSIFERQESWFQYPAETSYFSAVVSRWSYGVSPASDIEAVIQLSLWKSMVLFCSGTTPRKMGFLLFLHGVLELLLISFMHGYFSSRLKLPVPPVSNPV